MSLGVIDVSRDSLEYNLTQKGAGHSVVIVVGGAAEIREMGFDSYALIMKRRKGFIKLALQTGLVYDFSAFKPEDCHSSHVTVILSRSEARIFHGGGGGVKLCLKEGTRYFCHRNIVGCLLKRGLRSGDQGHPGAPPSLATPLLSFWHFPFFLPVIVNISLLLVVIVRRS